MSRRYAILCMMALLLLGGCAGKSTPMAGDDITRPSRQLVLVVAEDWNYTEAELQRYERGSDAEDWRPVGKAVPVNIGRHGLGWGRGLHGLALGPGPVKREGDGRAPVGLFAIGEGFAADPAQAADSRLPVRKTSPDILCVDDGASRYYNTIIDRREVPAVDWTSAEDMVRKDGQYRLGAYVHHNTNPAVPGGGSCIFLHIWLGRGVASSGCTNMDQPDMLALLRWLDADKRPVLAQLPRREYGRLCSAWRLCPAGATPGR